MCWARGANSISAPFTLQPSEFLKPSFAILAAAVLADRQPLAIPKPVVTFLLLVPALAHPAAAARCGPDRPAALPVGRDAVLLGHVLCLGGRAGVGVAGVLGFVAYEIFPHVHHRVEQYLGDSDTGYQAGLALKAFAHGGLDRRRARRGHHQIPHSRRPFRLHLRGGGRGVRLAALRPDRRCCSAC